MKLSQALKAEIAGLPDEDCCRSAMLSAIVHTAGTLSFTRGGVKVLLFSAGAQLGRLASGLVKALYGAECLTSGRETAISGAFVTEMLMDLGILSYEEDFEAVPGISPFMIMKPCCRSAYLRGAFLGAGSLSVESNYRAEFKVSNKEFAIDLQRLLNGYGISARTAETGGRFALYVKGGDSVASLAAAMGADKTVLKLMDLMVGRLTSQNVNRQTNCDMANIDRTTDASARQIEAIKKIWPALKGKLKETAALRLDHPEDSYEELAGLLGVSKSSVKYRLNKITELANE